MSTAAAKESVKPNLGDSFAISVLVMLLISVLQRSVGFLRGLGFAHFLSDADLGRWALANSFFIITVPIAVLGLPGSFGKFVEYFRVRNELPGYIRRVWMASAVGTALTAVAIFFTREQFSLLVFGEPTSTFIVLWCIVALLCMITFCFINELVTALRQVRTVSHMQFLQSFVFAVLGLVLLAIYRSWWVLLPSFAISNCLAIVPGWLKLRDLHDDELRATTDVPPQSQPVWSRIVPFAVALWVMNLLSNLFEVGDRYMLLHLTPASLDGQAMVGQYHCARILPNLLTSIGLMLGGVLLPYLSADWEADRKDRITVRIRQVLQGMCIGFTGLSIAAMVASPIIFSWLFKGRYDLAETALPLALAQAIWVSLFLVAETYMLCAEKVKQLSALLMVSLVVNLGLNWAMIPHLGLLGAVTATSMANVLALGLLFWRMGKSGCNVGMGSMVLCLAPAAIVFGPIVAMATLVAIVFVAGRTELLISSQDRTDIHGFAKDKFARYGIALPDGWLFPP